MFLLPVPKTYRNIVKKLIEPSGENHLKYYDYDKINTKKY